ncbi:HD domain-containing protein [Candidatus Bipolaricaulota bacterium]|nr:HD domain-containing protein [Candidatus Bipolaricaulota bacterium]
MSLNVPAKNNTHLADVVAQIDASEELSTLWAAANITAIDRMGINDHGPIHIRIVTNIGLKLLRLLVEGKVIPSVVQHHGLTYDDAEVVVVMACVLHDIGHVIHRKNHEFLSLMLAPALIDTLLEPVYDLRTRTILKGEILHAIYAHQKEIVPLTIEAGVVKVADALDMESGRARIPFKTGSPTIHSVSAMAIQNVRIDRGTDRPIKISIEMSNSAGIFQVDSLLREKLQNSTIAPFVEVVAEVLETEKKILHRYSID